MASHTNGKCKVCSKPAGTRCSRCAEGVEYDGSPSAAVHYCSSGCQKSDFPSHKKACKTSHNRKLLYRAASLAQATFYALQKSTFQLNVTEVVLDSATKKLRVFVGGTTADQAANPLDLFKDDRALHSALATWSSSNDLFEASMLAQTLVRLAFFGIADIVAHLKFKPPAASRIVEFASTAIDSEPVETSQDGEHVVLIIGTEDGFFALDVAGAELGIHEPLVPVPVYMQKVVEIRKVTMHKQARDAVEFLSRWLCADPVTVQGPQVSKATDKLAAARTQMIMQCNLIKNFVLDKRATDLTKVLAGRREVFEDFVSEVAKELVANMPRSMSSQSK
ncbi:hypothetical protein B0A48_10423 [Cryoendolithus antarcticus]|uniref:MYND-type domain-containing protein n=1 Tax=Cryoendolithus antarcticus TaxID=1507870 RepID=A0A1V8SX98_9PEZI|nr:hypothetical protein B0A48_10423 [Cryoendolithus antarcticus]